MPPLTRSKPVSPSFLLLSFLSPPRFLPFIRASCVSINLRIDRTDQSFLECLGLQKATAVPGQSSLQRIVGIATDMWKQEGFSSFYKGITPRVLRVAPGQAIVFAVYERVSTVIEKMTPTVQEDIHSE